MQIVTDEPLLICRALKNYADDCSKTAERQRKEHRLNIAAYLEHEAATAYAEIERISKAAICEPL